MKIRASFFVKKSVFTRALWRVAVRQGTHSGSLWVLKKGTIPAFTISSLLSSGVFGSGESWVGYNEMKEFRVVVLLGFHDGAK